MKLFSVLRVAANVLSAYTIKKEATGKVKDYGTKNLSDHLKFCVPTAIAANKQPRITSHVSRVGSKVPDLIKKRVMRLQSYFVAGALLPFQIMDNPYFHNLSNELISVGAKFGKVSVENVLSGRRTVQKDLLAMMEDVKKLVKTALNEGPISQ